MINASYYRQKAEDCRRIAGASKRSEFYLLELAEHFDRVAQATDLSIQGGRGSAGDIAQRGAR
jgi:hypothetical protein